jgi:O-antigen/teichoic acid export membrane protein
MNEAKQGIGKKALSGMLWSSGGSFAFQFVRILTQIILARLLWPEAFGMVALAMAFVSVANYLIENGLTLFLIRKKTLEQNDSYTLLVANVIFAVSIIVGLILLSTPISIWLGEKEVKLLLVISTSAILFNALGSVHKALLTRELAFKGQTIILLIAAIVSGLVAIGLSYFGFGVWSLVLYNVLFQLIQTILIMIVHPIKLGRELDFSFLKQAVVYSWKLMASGLIHTVYENIFNLIMGSLYSVSILGYYSNALKIRDGAAQTLTDAIQKVSFPVLSKFQDDRERLIDTTRHILRLSIFVIFPILFGLAASSEAIVNVVFNDQWLGMIPVMQVLAINGLLIPLHKVNLNLLTVVGRTDLYLKLEIQKKIVAFVTIALGLYLAVSLEGLLWILFLNAIIGYVLNVRYAGQLLGYGFIKQFKDIASTFMISLIMGTLVYLIPFLLNGSWMLKLLAQVLVGAISYSILAKIFVSDEFNEVWKLMNQVISKLLRKVKQLD